MKPERLYVLPSAGIERKPSRYITRFLLILTLSVAAFTIGFVLGTRTGIPRIPRCEFAPDVIIGNGEYNADTGYWSRYDCVSESAFSDHNYVNRKSGMQP